MRILSTTIPDLFVAESDAFRDDRGAFFRCFCADELQTVIGDRQIKQVNHSRTENVGAVRGMHFQFAPFGEMKLVRCLRGRVWDVAIDLRKGSSTFLKWHAEELTGSSFRMMMIPEGFAHGFQVLEPSSELLYLHTAPYNKTAEGGVRFNDPLLKIDWPLVPIDLSVRDQNHELLNDQFLGIY